MSPNNLRDKSKAHQMRVVAPTRRPVDIKIFFMRPKQKTTKQNHHGKTSELSLSDPPRRTVNVELKGCIKDEEITRNK